MDTFLSSLRVMGIGMLGIFAVTAVIILVIVILTKVFPEKKDKNKQA
ncbi:MAG TPA: hypothetical protein PLN48_06890 [Lachnospiraceae bacterium]|nr:hypothetical protein [Lachnospiraceae bacterium]